jgi:hypothetical protein
MYRSISLLDPGLASEIEIKNRFVTASVQYHGVDWNMGAYSGSNGSDVTANPLIAPISFVPQQLPYTASISMLNGPLILILVRIPGMILTMNML